MDGDPAALEGDPGATLGHVKRVGDPDDPRLQREGLAVVAMARDRAQDLGGDHGQLRLLVQPVEQLTDLRLGQEEAEVLVTLAVDGHADAVQQRSERDGDLGVVGLESVVADERGLHVVLGQEAQEPQRDVRHDLDVHPGVVVDLEPHGGVHVRHMPPALELVVGVRPLDQRPQLAVAPGGDVDSHLGDGLRRRQSGLPLRLVRDRLLDPLLGLLVERHRSGVYGHRCAGR